MSIAVKARQMLVKNSATLTGSTDFGDGLARLVFSLSVPDIEWTPGQAVALVVDPDGRAMKDRWRHYTIRRHDAVAGTVEFVVVRRDDDSPAQRWLRSLEPGASVTFMGPGGKPTVDRTAQRSLFVGDRTSIASIAAMIEALPSSTRSGVRTIIVTPHPDEAMLPVDGPVATTWVADHPERRTQQVLDALPDDLAKDTVAYVTGELQTMRAVRDRLVGRGLARRNVRCHAHWTPGRRGM